ncbi:hypothetical protein AX769_16015 [Frondihabitans sp. PAMC 28766]|nr:hypothetical protein AX769_16015 [Frondihabitans sp. PAMC 28766]
MGGHGGDALDTVGAWAKKYHLASRSVIEASLRDYGLGPTQYYVLYQLSHAGPTIQRDLGVMLSVERATLSGIVATLVRKGLVIQEADVSDQRQRVLRLTDAGRALWAELPDPVAILKDVAYSGISEADLAVARQVLQDATAKLTDYVTRLSAERQPILYPARAPQRRRDE